MKRADEEHARERPKHPSPMELAFGAAYPPLEDRLKAMPDEALERLAAEARRRLSSGGGDA